MRGTGQSVPRSQVSGCGELLGTWREYLGSRTDMQGYVSSRSIFGCRTRLGVSATGSIQF